MYYGKKKGIMIAVIALIILVVGGAGVAFAYFNTDLFKSNDELFFKYLGQAIEEAKFTKNTQLDNVVKLQEVNPYTIEGELTFNVEKVDSADSDQTTSNNNTTNNTTNTTNNSDNTTLSNNFKNAKVKVSAKVDKEKEMAYAKADLYNKQENIFTVEYANSNNIYALKSDEIVTAFIGVENDNLKVLSQKLFKQLDANTVPNSVEVQNYGELFDITEQEKEHIIETYSAVIKENIPKSAFTKETNIATVKAGVTYNTTGYRLNLNNEQLKQLEVALLQTLKTDSITLNMLTTKAKILGLDSSYTEVNQLTQVIDKEIANIQKSNLNTDGLSIVVYVDGGRVVTTEAILKNNVKLTMYTKSDAVNVVRNVLIENLGTSDAFGKISVNLLETKSATQSVMDLSINVDDLKTYSVYMSNEGSAESENLNTSVELSLTDETKTYGIQYEQKMQFVDELQNMISLNRSNCGILNDYSSEQLQTLLDSIGNKASEVLQKKAEILGIDLDENTNVEPTINEIMKAQDIENFNAMFESYKGEITGSGVKTLNTTINKHNEASKDRKVILTVDGVNVTGSTSNLKTTDNYNIELLYNDEGYIYQINATIKN